MRWAFDRLTAPFALPSSPVEASDPIRRSLTTVSKALDAPLSRGMCEQSHHYFSGVSDVNAPLEPLALM
jgi:hypothetical protein